MDPSRLDGGMYDPAADDGTDLDGTGVESLAERGDLDAELKSDLWADRAEQEAA